MLDAVQRIKEEVHGEESRTRLKNLQIRFESETLDQLKAAQAQAMQDAEAALTAARDELENVKDRDSRDQVDEYGQQDNTIGYQCTFT